MWIGARVDRGRDWGRVEREKGWLRVGSDILLLKLRY